MTIFRSFTLVSILVTSIVGASAFAGGEDDPLLAMLMVDELERGIESNDPISFDAQAWIGKDINKLWLKAEGDYKDSDEQSLEVQALYSRAIASYWDVQIGLKADLEPSPSREWVVLEVQGLAPYFFDIDAALFLGEKGRTSMRVGVEYELMLTQTLFLTPELELNLYGKDDAELGIGKGLSDISTALRLRYEIVREFAPYIGIERHQQFGNTADFARAAGTDTTDTRFVVGVKLWF